MKKKSGEEIKFIEVDPITGEYHVIIPEWIVNEISWYEETPINFTVEGNELILREHKYE
jgi:hypothetical protein